MANRQKSDKVACYVRTDIENNCTKFEKKMMKTERGKTVFNEILLFVPMYGYLCLFPGL